MLKIKLHGKKALLMSWTTELAFAIIIMTILFGILLFVSYNRTVHVHALVEADKAQFACRNNLITLMNFKYDDTYTYEHKLILSYAEDDYSEFESRLNSYMNNFFEKGSWKLAISDSNKTKTFGEKALEITDLNNEGIVDCSILIPVMCSGQGSCTLDIVMENKYEKQ